MEKGLTWEEVGGYPCTLDPRFGCWWRERGSKEVGGNVLKTHFVVSKITLSAQNCIKHIQEKTHYIWGLKFKTSICTCPFKMTITPGYIIR